MKAYYIQEGDTLKSVLYAPLFLKEEEIIPKGIKVLGERCFSFTNSIQKIVIPDTVTTIKKGAFYNNKTIECVIIPSSVEMVEEGAFAGCESLKEVYYTSNTRFGQRCFDHCCNLEKIVCDDREARIFYFKGGNRFAITFLIAQEKNYNLYRGLFAEDDFPQGDPEKAGDPLYFIQTKQGHIWYAENIDECLLAATYQDSKKSFAEFFNKTILADGTITPLDVSFLTGICYKGRLIFEEVFGGDDNTEWSLQDVLSFLNRRYPKLGERLIYALNHQEEYNPLLSIDHGIHLSDFVRE